MGRARSGKVSVTKLVQTRYCMTVQYHIRRVYLDGQTTLRLYQTVNVERHTAPEAVLIVHEVALDQVKTGYRSWFGLNISRTAGANMFLYCFHYK